MEVPGQVENRHQQPPHPPHFQLPVLLGQRVQQVSDHQADTRHEDRVEQQCDPDRKDNDRDHLEELDLVFVLVPMFLEQPGARLDIPGMSRGPSICHAVLAGSLTGNLGGCGSHSSGRILSPGDSLERVGHQQGQAHQHEVKGPRTTPTESGTGGTLEHSGDSGEEWLDHRSISDQRDRTSDVGLELGLRIDPGVLEK